MVKLSRYHRIVMHGCGISHAPLKLKSDPWWKDVNGVWWAWGDFTYWLTFRRETRHWDK